MEVFVHNLPSQGDLSDRALKIQLQPFTRKLAIPDASYFCEKTAKKRHAFLTFLFEKDGQRFLDAHGAVKQPFSHRTTSRLRILGANVMCQVSNREANAITLRALAAEVDKARGLEQTPPTHTEVLALEAPGPTTGMSINATAPMAGKRTDTGDTTWSFLCRSMSCGYYKFNNNELAFVPETTEYYAPNMSIVHVGKRRLTLECADGTSIHIPLLSVHEIVWSSSGVISLTLMDVPHFLSKKGSRSDGKRTRLTALNDRHAKIVGMCLVYYLEVVPDQMHRKMQKLGDLGGLAVTRYDLTSLQQPCFAESERALKHVLAFDTAAKALPFSLLMQLQALAFNAYLHPTTVAQLTKELCKRYPANPISADAMKSLYQAISWPSPNYHDPEEFEVPALLNYLIQTERDMQDGSFIRGGLKTPGNNLTPVYRVSVTPTRLTLHGPELENKNRVLRMFPNHHDYFIRVQFCDEDGQALRFNNRIDFDLVYSRFHSIMTNGIQVAGRTYTFLGWSHSSLRAHSMWFTAPFMDDKGKLQTHFSIVSTLGDFDSIRSPARCAARIGQAFSETPFAVPIAENNICITRIQDVTSHDGTRVFSDGVGTMSQDVANVVWRQLPRGKKQPTCLQVRYAGAKGMLSLDAQLYGKVICLRPSMVKFESDENANLEICDMASRPIPFYLNRQLIKILEDMGVPKSWFLRLQNAALLELKLITSSSYNMANFLRSQSVATAIKAHKVLLLADQLGLDYRSDPFLRRASDAVILRELRLLKHKARILVPFGVTLFGVMDETGLLGEGQIYVTFEVPKRSKSQRFKLPPCNRASLLITRSPALHPGDIQRATNIIPPDNHPLHNLRNCIVFNARGHRDFPSQLSGGDLDGDIFNVLWDPEVCNLPTLQTFPPADYPRQTPVDINRAVTRDDIASFFVDFLRTDHLGAIATRHTILADQLDAGTLEQQCIEVAKMHSTAVDFSKTGIPADLKKLPWASKFRPDFLAPGPIAYVHDRTDIVLEEIIEYIEKYDEDVEDKYELDAPRYKYYRSEKVLGTLYRAIDERKIWRDSIQRPPEKINGKSFYETFLDWAMEQCESFGCYDWQSQVDEALRIRSAYEDAILNTMYEFSEHPTQPITELEVFIGSIINKTGTQTTRQRDSSRKLHDAYERISAWITAQIRRGTKGHGDNDEKGDSDGDDSGDGPDSNGLAETDSSGWLTERQQVLGLCLACVRSMKEDKALTQDKDSSEPTVHDRTEKGPERVMESFWLVAVSALMRELEFVRHGLAVDTGLENDMALLGL